MKEKRKSTEEIEIDLAKNEPLNKKQKRLLKRGKIDETGEKVGKYEKTGPSTGGDKKTDFGVWIGNISFETDRLDLIKFLESRQIHIDDIIRVHMPLKNKRHQGFAYVDLSNQLNLEKCIALSESDLNGRNLLIKNATSFKGRPPSKDSQNHKPSRILFVGNLSFDTTKDQLESHFQHCGEITRIRMATFEDTGNCKGFAFVDFQSIESAAAALEDKRCKKLNGRDLRMEYGEDRSQRRPGGKNGKEETGVETVEKPQKAASAKEAPKFQENSQKPSRSIRKPKLAVQTSGQALVNAQRGSVGIAVSQGKKVTFD